jgi:hypothetical protein
MNPFGLLVIAVGALLVRGGINRWRWFMNSREAKFIAGRFGDTGVRVFFIVLGLAFMALGALMTAGVISW